MNTTFKDWFCLNNRETFTIDAKINPADAQFYFGRDQLRDRMKKQISRAFIDPQVPKMMIWGAYGSGKTQTLYYLAHELVNSTPVSCKGRPHVVHLAIEVHSKSVADLWHLQMTESLGMATVQGWLQMLLSKSANFDQEVDRLTADSNIALAFKQLRGGGDLAFSTWRWLTGQRLTTKELQEIKVTRNLVDVGVGDMVLALQSIGNLARAVDRCLIFCVDEMEELRNIRAGDAADSWHQYARKLADNSCAAAYRRGEGMEREMSAGFLLRCALVIPGLSVFGYSAHMETKEERVLRSIQRGRVSIQMGRYQDAIASFQESVELNPKAVVGQGPTLL